MARKNFQTLLDKMTPERRARIEAEARQLVEEIALQDLRQALNLTQGQVARALKINQAAVSKMEGQSDMYVTTLQRYVTALGGRLKLVASFPDREAVINQFDLESVDIGMTAQDMDRTRRATTHKADAKPRGSVSPVGTISIGTVRGRSMGVLKRATSAAGKARSPRTAKVRKAK